MGPPLTCSVSQSDLQRGKRDEPAELEGVRVSVRERRARGGLGRGEIQTPSFTTKTSRGAACDRNGAYRLLLQLVVLPVDQYHRFLEHW